MDRIKILSAEIENLEKDKSRKSFSKLYNNEKLDFLNEQLEIINKKLDITNILLRSEKDKKFIQDIIGRPPQPNRERQKSIVDIILKNKEHMSPTILGIYGKEIEEESREKSSEEKPFSEESTSSIEESSQEENIKVNFDQYLEGDGDSDYEDSLIEKLKELDITDESKKKYEDVKPNTPIVVNPGKSSQEESTSSNMNPGWKINEEEQENPVRKYIDRRQYYTRKTNDYFPMKYTPYDKEPQALNPTGIYLDLDCVADREKMLTMWIKENGAIINKEGMTKDQGIEFLRRTMRGSVERYIESLGNRYDDLKKDSENSIVFLSNLEKILRVEFLGYSSSAQDHWEIDKENAIKGMMNISICNMCYFDQYTCEYTEWFYKARFQEVSLEYDFYGKMYYEKLPEPFRSRIINDFTKKIKELDGENQVATLGARIWFAKNKITDYCLEASNQNKIYKYQKRQLCRPINNEIGRYGCNKPFKKKRKWRFKKTNFRDYDGKKRYFKKRKFNKFRPRYPKRDNPNKSSNPKKCTCFICKQEGHYANQCPKRNKQNIKILEEIYEYGFEPQESEIESDYSLYNASMSSEEESDNE